MRPCCACSTVAAYAYGLTRKDGRAFLHADKGKMTVGYMYATMTKCNVIATLGLKSCANHLAWQHSIDWFKVSPEVNTVVEATYTRHRMLTPPVGRSDNKFCLTERISYL